MFSFYGVYFVKVQGKERKADRNALKYKYFKKWKGLTSRRLFYLPGSNPRCSEQAAVGDKAKVVGFSLKKCRPSSKI